MTHWKVQLHQTRQECSPRRWLNRAICFISSLLFIFFSTGCQPKQIDAYTNQEWIHEMIALSGITPSSEGTPYFINVTSDNSFFNDIQAAVEWGILNQEDGFLPEDVLTREFTAYTLINLIDLHIDANIQIQDANDCMYLQEVKDSVAGGLMELDNRNLFHPKDVIEKEESLDLLQKAVDYLNNLDFSTENESNHIEYRDDVDVKEVTPSIFDSENLRATFDPTTSLTEGDIISWNDDENTYTYKVSSFDGSIAQLEEIDIFDYTDEIHVSGQDEINFDQADITLGNGVKETGSLHGIDFMAVRPLTKEFDINGFSVSLSTSSNQLKAEVSRTLPYGAKLYAGIKINSIHVDYKWFSNEDSVREAYFKVRFQSVEDLGFKASQYKNLYGDFSKIDSKDFLSTVQNLFQSKNDVVTQSFTIAEIDVPLASNPTMSLTVNLKLNMHASGKIELDLVQQSELGCQVRDGKMRLIQSLTPTAKCSAKASAAITASIHFGLSCLKTLLADVGLEAGAEAGLTSTLHLYDQDGNRNVVSSDLPLDVLEELSQDNDDILVCGDINAYWVLNVVLNSKKSLLGKLGLKETFEILDSDNSSLLPNGKKHIENFQFVPRCTRKDRSSTTADTIQVNKKITLKKYAIVVHMGTQNTIEVTGLPDGYEFSDLLFRISDSSIAEIDNNGNISGLSVGSAIVTIETKDHTHSITCNVLVTEG